MGAQTGKIIDAVILSLKCAICNQYNNQNVPLHKCSKNFEGSSKSMEAEGALQLCIKAHNRSYNIGVIVSDDDSTMRAVLRHSHTDKTNKDANYKWPRNSKTNIKVKDTGRLPLHIPEPTFYADPSHRTKIVAKKFFALKTMGKTKSEITMADCLRMKKYHGYFLKQNRHKTKEEFAKAAKAPLEHLFDNHEFCGSWCQRKKKKEIILLTTNSQPKTNIEPITVSNNDVQQQRNNNQEPTINIQQPEISNEKGITNNHNITTPTNDLNNNDDSEETYYRDKERDKKLYIIMKDIYDEFITEDRLEESRHGFTTQANESFNTTIASYAPKNKTYSMTMSLKIRIHIVLGIKNYGNFQYWEKVFNKLKLVMPERLYNYLKKYDTNFTKRKEKSQTKTFKQKRAFIKNEKLKEENAKTKKAMKKNMNYGSGIGLNGTTGNQQYCIEIQNNNKNIVCPLPGCGIKGHKTNRAKKCRWYKMFIDVEKRDLPAVIESHISKLTKNNENENNKNIDFFSQNQPLNKTEQRQHNREELQLSLIHI